MGPVGGFDGTASRAVRPAGFSGRLAHGAVGLQVAEAPARLPELGQPALGRGPEPQEEQADGADGGPTGHPGGHRAWHWGGEVTSDSCVRIGTVEAEVPGLPGNLVLDLTLTAGDVTATNRYQTVIEA